MKKAITAYVLKKPFGDMAEGDLVHLDADEAEPLVEAGILEEATPDDVNGEDDEDEDQDEDEGEGDEMAPADNAALTRAVNQITRNLEGSIAKATQLAVKKVAPKKSNIVIPATVKGPIFKCMGDMLLAQVKAHQGDRTSRNRLAAYRDEIRLKSPLGANEGTNSEGGYAVKPEWFTRIWDKVREYPKLLDKTERMSINSNTLNIPALNETSLADGSRHGGIQAYWVSEGSTATSSYPALTQVQAVLNTQVVLVYVTNQLLQDANIEAFDTFVGKKVALEVLWQENYAVVQGSGSGQPKGIMNQASLITVAKNSNDGTAMFSFADLANMWRSLYPPSRANACWLMNPEAYASLAKMTFPDAASTSVYPAWSLTYDAHEEFPYRIFGAPVIENMSNPQLGNAGDIILCDLSQLVTAERPGLQADVSYEIQFTTLQTAFRFVRRYDLQSPWTAALSSVDGHYSYSPFVCIASRGT